MIYSQTVFSGGSTSSQCCPETEHAKIKVDPRLLFKKDSLLIENLFKFLWVCIYHYGICDEKKVERMNVSEDLKAKLHLFQESNEYMALNSSKFRAKV